MKKKIKATITAFVILVGISFSMALSMQGYGAFSVEYLIVYIPSFFLLLAVTDKAIFNDTLE